MKRTRQSQQQVPNLKLSRRKRRLPKRGRARSRQQSHHPNMDLTDPEMPPISKKMVHQVPEGPLATRIKMLCKPDPDEKSGQDDEKSGHGGSKKKRTVSDSSPDPSSSDSSSDSDD